MRLPKLVRVQRPYRTGARNTSHNLASPFNAKIRCKRQTGCRISPSDLQAVFSFSIWRNSAVFLRDLPEIAFNCHDVGRDFAREIVRFRGGPAALAQRVQG